jgi:hypothetical protein
VRVICGLATDHRGAGTKAVRWMNIPYPDPSPSFCVVENGRLEWVALPPDPFWDDDLFDAEILNDRLMQGAR